MCHLPKFDDPNLLVGFETSDDAAVYQIDDHTALIQTVDIFPPVVDDPFHYGQIAAANSLSDVYAMGGSPKLAMNILCVPEDMEQETVGEILQGGYAKVQEAGAVICGGHTIKDNEPKYGLCVSGFVHPRRFWKNANAQAGDILILTKALGTGILNTAMKADLISSSAQAALTESMTALNRAAAEIASHCPVNSCTDITGFGLAGHAYEMASGSQKSLVIESDCLPVLPQALEMAQMGIVPKGAYNNRAWLGCSICFHPQVPAAVEDVLFDPQTSGGLLFSVPEKEGIQLARQLGDCLPAARVIGYVEEGSGPLLSVK